MAQHVGVNQEVKAGALPNAFIQPINRVRRERTATLGADDVFLVRELPLEFAECPDLVAAKRVNATRLSVLCPANVQGCRSAKLNL